VRVRMGQFVVVEDRCHEAVVPAPLVPVELDCLAYTGSRKYPRIPHQCHFGHPPLSFRAQREILARKPRFLSRSLSPSFEAGSFEMTMGRVPSQTKRVFRPTRPAYPRRCRGLLYAAPQERGSKPRSPQCGVECFCRGERLLALLPRHLLHRARFVILVPENKCEFHSG
jgi:hypothetical protein